MLPGIRFATLSQFFVGVGAFVIRLSQISSLFLYKDYN